MTNHAYKEDTNLVDPDIQPLYVHLCLLAPVLASLQLVDQLKDLSLQSSVEIPQY